MVVEPFRVFTADTRTGLISADLTVIGEGSGLRWSIRLNDAGTITARTVASSKQVRHLELASITEPVKQSLGVAYADTILECGPIWSQRYDPRTDILELTAAGIWSLLDRRIALPWLALLQGKKPADLTLRIVGKTLGSIAREFVRGSIQDNPSGGLPIILPPDTPGANERNIEGYKLSIVGELLRNLTQVQNGPDIRFRPRYKDSDRRYIEWVMETGTPEKPILSRPEQLIWNGTVEKSGVIGFSVSRTAEDMAARIYQPGAGTEKAVRMGWADDSTLVKAGYPYLETVQAGMDVADEAILKGHAQAALALNRHPVSTWGAVVDAHSDPKLGTYLPGDMATVTVPNTHPLLPGGMSQTRIMAIDGDPTQQVKLAFAPIGG